MEATAPANIPQLVADLSDANSTKRAQAAEALSRLGPKARPAAVALIRACGDDAEEIREYAGSALEEMGPPAAEDVGSLTALLTGAIDDGTFRGAFMPVCEDLIVTPDG